MSDFDISSWDHYRPIDDDAKHGNSQIVRRRDTFATAYWTGDMWAYRLPRRPGDSEPPAHQIDFEPTHYLNPDIAA